MTITVSVKCAWCQKIEESTLKEPVPPEWTTTSVTDPGCPLKSIDENFCSEEHQKFYEENAPKAHDAAAKDYTAKFYATMNELRKKPPEA